MPPAIECGATFRVKVGVKCGAGCRATGWRVEVRDPGDNVLATGFLSEAPWPGTAALYHAEAELKAPDAEGLHVWHAHVPAADGDISDDGGREASTAEHELSTASHEASTAKHKASTMRFNVRTVSAPEFLLKVVAVDAQRQVPVQGARVVVHAYRSFTDEHGVAAIRVPRGGHRLFVSSRDYSTFRTDAEVNSDVTIRAELDPDAGLSDADLWY
jgi:hypothetical protein